VRARLAGSLVTVALAACTSSSVAASSTSPRPIGTGTPVSSGSTGSPVVVHLMEFNIEYGGTQVDFAGVPAAIRAAGADVVALEEGYGNVPRVAEALGWSYYDVRTQVVSRFPLLTPSDAGPYVLVEVAPGRVAAIGNVHLPSTGYGPFLIERGATRKEVIANEEHKRVPAVQPTLDALSKLAGLGMPVFLTGDFNAPSHLDWTKQTVGLRPQIKFPVDWPVSALAEQAGLRDSYREVHPDPIANPGITWPANRPFVKGYNPYPAHRAADRIDFIYSGGPATATDSVIVGEQGSDGVDVTSSPWPTDHRATLSTFRVQPAVPPTIVSVASRLISVGEPSQVTFHAPAAEGDHLIVTRHGNAHAVADMPTGGGTDGSLSIPTDGWDPGAYDVALIDASGTELARAPLWVRAPGQAPQVSMSRSVYRRGQPLLVRWAFAPGERWDWYGVYKRGANPNVAYYKEWGYTGATVQGSAMIDAGTNGGPWPLPPGRYSIYLLQDDSYHKLGGANFTVR
jgi:endonuclease/exonuclease/phosphatase family metal-dependent hydrolase